MGTPRGSPGLSILEKTSRVPSRPDDVSGGEASTHAPVRSPDRDGTIDDGGLASPGGDERTRAESGSPRRPDRSAKRVAEGPSLDNKRLVVERRSLRSASLRSAPVGTTSRVGLITL